MDEQTEFGGWFDTIAPQLGYRERSFRQIFRYLDEVEAPITIVETGCLREDGNFSGDGQSTLLFDRYAQSRGADSKVYTVDINPECTAVCRRVVSDRVEVTTGDSVQFLHAFAKDFPATGKRLSLLYLDSFDLDWRSPFPSAAHHLKELAAALRIVDPATLVVVDDSPAQMNVVQAENNAWQQISTPVVGGKGFLVNEFAAQVGARVLFSHYQTAWNNFSA